MCEHGFLKVRNWETFQHYKNRNPPWIKLATDTFQNYDFGRLQDASKLLAICIWTLAARSEVGESGSIPNDLDWIKSQCGLGSEITKKNMQELIDKGFMFLDSNALADCKQNACLEGEGEAEAEGEKKGSVVVASRKKKEIDYQSIMDLWNTNTEGTPFPSLVAMTDKRKKLIKANIDDTPDWASMLVPVINHISGIEFFTGKNDRGWKASFDYLLQKGKLVELFEKSSSDLSVREPKIDLSPWEDPSYIARRPERAIS